MENILRSATDLALHLIRSYIKQNSTIIDATCGNGHDTVALTTMLQTAGAGNLQDAETGRIIAFDIQSDAIASTRLALAEAGFDPDDDGFTFVCDSHENMARYADSADVIVFNLGYLPGGSKSITTRSASTLIALNSAIEILNINGVICITMYSGHEAGRQEKKVLLEFAETLDRKKFHVVYTGMINQPNNPPELLLITKKL